MVSVNRMLRSRRTCSKRSPTFLRRMKPSILKISIEKLDRRPGNNQSSSKRHHLIVKDWKRVLRVSTNFRRKLYLRIRLTWSLLMMMICRTITLKDWDTSINAGILEVSRAWSNGVSQ